MGRITKLTDDEDLLNKDVDEIFIDSLPTEIMGETNELAPVEFISLKFDERSRPRRRCLTNRGTKVVLALPRGTVLTDGLLIYNSSSLCIKVKAAVENVIVIRPVDNIQLCAVAHHLGNWHRSIQLNADGTLVIEPDEPLFNWLTQQKIQFQDAQLTFHPNLKGALHETIVAL